MPRSFWKSLVYGPFFILLAAVLWGADGVLRRSLYSLPPITIVFYEHLIGALLIAPFFFRAARKERLNRREWAAILWVSLLSGVLGTLWFTTALLKTNFISFSVVFLLQKLQPVFAIGTAALLLKERLQPKYVLWSLVALIAAYFVTFPGGAVNLQTGAGTITAALFAVGAAFAWGSTTAFSRYALLEHSHTLITGLRFWLTAPMALLFVLFMGQAGSLGSPAPAQIGTLIIISLSTGMVALWIYYRGLKRTQAKVSAILELVFPLTGVLIDVVLYRNFLQPSQYAAALALLFAIYQVSKLNLASGKVQEAMIVSGKGRGRRINYPTLNLHLPETLDATHGIYAGWVGIDGRKYPAAFHYGPIPTFDESEIALEAFLLDTALAERPDKVSFELVQYIRPVRRFGGPDQLADQIGKDVAEVKKILGV